MDRRVFSYGLAGLVIVLDRVTKLWIERSVGLWDRHTVIPGFFDIVHTQNRGMAFGLFADGDSRLRSVLLIGVALVVLVIVASLIWRMPREFVPDGRTARLSLGLVLGGAVGNLWDRIFRGSVTDFLDFHAGGYHWPAFNVADSAITVGAALLAFGLLRAGPARSQEA